MAESIPTDAELWRQSERLRALARTLLSDPASGEDLVQETWLAALRRPRAIRRSAEGWLVGALRHLAWRTRERERRRGAVEERAARGELVEGPVTDRVIRSTRRSAKLVHPRAVI